MRWLTAVALMFITITFAPAIARAEENHGSAGYMLPLCKSWLRLASQEKDAVKRELDTGNARPGGIVMHVMLAGACAGMVIGVSETLRTFGTLCPPDGVSNEQLVRMVVNEIEGHPEHLHEDFIVPVAGTLIGTWPCGAK
jgi:hypothetical protein